jgi:hypothetical protein
LANTSVDFRIKDISVDFVNKTIYILSEEQEIFKLPFKVEHDNIIIEGKPEKLIKAQD